MLDAKNVDKKLPEYKKIAEIYEKSFPDHEKFPLWLLNILSKRRGVDFLAFYDDHLFCGFAYLITYKKTTVVLYLAIDDSLRSKGYGSKILNWITENKQENVVLNIESVSDQYDNYKERLNRQKFYLKNGFKDTKYQLIDKSNVYDILHKGNQFSNLEYEELFRHFSFGILRGKLTK